MNSKLNKIYIYENRSGADLVLPKKSLDGKTEVRNKERFKGDESFFELVRSPYNFLILVEDITLKNDEIKLEETKMHTEQLILDQPDIVTTSGKVETKIVVEKPLNDSNENKDVEVLLTETPIDGLEIIQD